MNEKFKQIVKLFQKLPGVGPRQAARFVMALLDKSDDEVAALGLAIANLKKDISTCPQCFNVSDNGLCSICKNPVRDQTKLMVIEKVTDLDSIERTGLYKGLYHVLGGSINPLDGILPQHLHIKELESRLSNPSSNLELILATNPSTSGETTSLYIKNLLKDKKLNVTRLGRGLASGSHLEYADETTLKNALDYRK